MTIGRRPKSIRPVRKEISLPEDIVAAVDGILFDRAAGRLPVGAWSDYIIALINEDLQKQRAGQ